VRTLCSAVLGLEAIVLFLAIPVALTLSDTSTGVVLWVGGALVVACFVGAGAMRGREQVGLAIGWVVQVVALASGFVVPAMFFLGGLFAILWFLAIRLGRKGDAATAAHEASRDGG
jgi:hypothetical protein